MAQEIQKASPTSPSNLPAEKSISLDQRALLDLSGLPDEAISELKKAHASGMIELRKKAEELKIDVAALDATLETFTQQTGKATVVSRSW